MHSLTYLLIHSLTQSSTVQILHIYTHMTATEMPFKGLILLDAKKQKDWTLMQLTCHNLQSFTKNSGAQHLTIITIIIVVVVIIFIDFIVTEKRDKK